MTHYPDYYEPPGWEDFMYPPPPPPQRKGSPLIRWQMVGILATGNTPGELEADALAQAAALTRTPVERLNIRGPFQVREVPSDDDPPWKRDQLGMDAQRKADGRTLFALVDVAEYVTPIQQMYPPQQPGWAQSELTMEALAREMYPDEYAAITDDHPMDPELVAHVERELARRKAAQQ